MKSASYSIKDLENLTNIKAHTICIWEQRYNLLSPKRTETNIRYYSDNDLKKILNINLLYVNGLKISKIALLSEQEILEQSKELLLSQSKPTNNDLEVLMIGIIDLDAERIKQTLDKIYERSSVMSLYQDTIIPLLERIGELWQLNSLSVGHEHFFSNLLRDFLISKIHQCDPPKENAPCALLFLHSEEEHELSLIFFHLLFKQKGWNVVYLGQRVPIEDLKITYDQVKPDLVVTSFIKHLPKEQFQLIIKGISEIVDSKKLVVSGKTALNNKKSLSNNTLIIKTKTDVNTIFV